MTDAKSRVKRYHPIGRCIYCGARGPGIRLSKEHIMPYTLGGDAILPQASCPRHAKMTREVEAYCARYIFEAVRLQHKVHSRSDNLPTTLPVLETFAPDPAVAPQKHIPLAQHPSIMILPSPPPPGMLRGEPPGADFHRMGFFIIDVTGENEKRLADMRKDGIAGKYYYEIKLQRFFQMIAKVAHCCAVAELGVDGFRPMLIQTIETGQDAAHLIGSNLGTTPPRVPMQHWARIERREFKGKTYCVAFLRFFPYLETPLYTAICGETVS